MNHLYYLASPTGSGVEGGRQCRYRLYSTSNLKPLIEISVRPYQKHSLTTSCLSRPNISHNSAKQYINRYDNAIRQNIVASIYIFAQRLDKFLVPRTRWIRVGTYRRKRAYSTSELTNYLLVAAGSTHCTDYVDVLQFHWMHIVGWTAQAQGEHMFMYEMSSILSSSRFQYCWL